MKKKHLLWITMTMTIATMGVTGCGTHSLSDSTEYKRMDVLDDSISAELDFGGTQAATERGTEIDLNRDNKEASGDENTQKYTVIKSTDVFSKPQSDASKVGKVKTGDSIEVIEATQNKKWYKIVFDGRVAYLAAESVEKDSQSAEDENSSDNGTGASSSTNGSSTRPGTTTRPGTGSSSGNVTRPGAGSSSGTTTRPGSGSGTTGKPGSGSSSSGGSTVKPGTGGSGSNGGSGSSSGGSGSGSGSSTGGGSNSGDSGNGSADSGNSGGATETPGTPDTEQPSQPEQPGGGENQGGENTDEPGE